MSSDSPAAIIFNTDGYEVSITDGYAVSSNRAALLVAGTDGSNYQFLHTDSSGNPIVVGAGTSGSPSGGVVSVQGVSGGQSLPVSGSVTANIGTTNGLALDATLTGGTAKAIVRGGAKGATTAADVTSTVSGANHQSLDVSLYDASGNLLGTSGSPIRIDPTGSTTQPISATSLPLPTGAATSAKQPTLGTAGTPSADVITVQGITSMTPLKVDGSGVTQPISGSVTVSGTVTANIGTTNGLALDATLTGGTAKSIVRGGAKGATAAADVTSENVDANTQALHVFIKGGGSSGGTSSNFTSIFPSSGTAAGFSDGYNMQGARVYDGYVGLDTEYVLGTILRASGASGTVEAGTSTNPLRIDPTGTTTQPVSATSLPLPTGAATSAKQPALGTAGTPSSDVITIQGITSMTPLKVDGSGFTQPVSGSVTANIGTTNGLALDATLTGGTAKSIVRGGAKGATTAADVTSQSVDANTQALHVYIAGGGGSGGTASSFNATFPSTGTASGFSDGTNMQSARVYDGYTGAGTEYLLGTVLRASGATGTVEAGTSTNPLRIDPTGTTFQPVKIYDANSTIIKSTVSQELKVAQLYTFADLTSKYELDNRLWDVKTATGGTVVHVPAQSAIRAAVTASSGSTAEACTNTYYKYQSGYTQFISMSIINSDAGQTNQNREWGYFDTSDGVFFRLSGTTFSIVERTSTSGAPVETTYAQSAWNVDKLNGTGASGVTLDLSKGNIFEIEIQWFGVGTVRYSINGILVHQVAHANTLAVPYMATATLPIQLRVQNTGASAIGSITMVCTRVAAQGQTHDPFEWVYSSGNTNDKTVGITEVPIFSIRPKATYNSITNRSFIIPKRLTVSTEGYKLSYKLIYGATLTGASWTSVTAKSATEYDESATAYSGGELIYSHFIPQDEDGDDIDLEPFFDVFGRIIRNAGYSGTGTNVADILTVVAVNQAVGTTKVRANMTWAEVK